MSFELRGTDRCIGVADDLRSSQPLRLLRRLYIRGKFSLSPLHGTT